MKITSKENKNVEVRIEGVKKDTRGKNYEVTQLFIGKKTIGEILVYGLREYEIFSSEGDLGKEKSLENAIGTVTRHRNLYE